MPRSLAARPGSTPPAMKSTPIAEGEASRERMISMLQGLLEDRFQMKAQSRNRGLCSRCRQERRQVGGGEGRRMPDCRYIHASQPVRACCSALRTDRHYALSFQRAHGGQSPPRLRTRPVLAVALVQDKPAGHIRYPASIQRPGRRRASVPLDRSPCLHRSPSATRPKAPIRQNRRRIPGHSSHRAPDRHLNFIG